MHPATVPLVRQQLDLLATGQFRWTGEAWPGARLDWTIEQDGDEWDRSGGGTASEDDQPWRTRLTLSLPTLGTVDAELTLTGTRLVARVQASPGGAARLATQGESFRQRLAAAGIELNGLTDSRDRRRRAGGATARRVRRALRRRLRPMRARLRRLLRRLRRPHRLLGCFGWRSASRPLRSTRCRAASDDFDWDI